MKAVDQTMFPNLKELDWKQDGIVRANVPLNASIQNGIYHFQTPELSGALNLNMYLNNMAGEKLGISAQTQGDAKEDKVGIYQGNQLQISKRMKLLSDSYEEMYEDVGTRYDWGLWTHADEEEMVRLISSDGIGWEKITKEDKDPEYIVNVITSATEMAETDDQKRDKVNVLLSIEKDIDQKALINLKAHIEEKYRVAGYDEAKIKKLMNNKMDATDELLSEAKKAIEMIIEGKDPGINYSATTGYLQYVSDWIMDNSEDLKPEVKAKLEAYFEQHVSIATKNAEQKQFSDNLMAGQTVMPAGQTIAPAVPVKPVNPINNNEFAR
jgi:hypothetical protein